MAESTLGLAKAQYVPHSVSKHLEKRGYTSAGRVPFIVSQRWKQRVKKQIGFRRRTGRQTEHDTVASGRRCGKIYGAKTICRKSKRKQKFGVMKRDTQKVSVPLLNQQCGPNIISFATSSGSLQIYEEM